jgi:hypothetical protein
MTVYIHCDRCPETIESPDGAVGAKALDWARVLTTQPGPLGTLGPLVQDVCPACWKRISGLAAKLDLDAADE